MMPMIINMFAVVFGMFFAVVMGYRLGYKDAIKRAAEECDPEPGVKYSPNSKSARADCKQRIESLL